MPGGPAQALGIRSRQCGPARLSEEIPMPASRRGAIATLAKGDVARFFDVTRGHVLIAGPRTIASIPAVAYEDRTIVEIRSNMAPRDVLAQFPQRVVYVGGGPPVWDDYAPFIRHWDITRLPYDGDADRWFDPAWLVASEKPE